MEVETSFGRWLQRRRKAFDLTQEELAQRVGCAAETLRKIEADVRRPSRQIAERLAEALEIPLAERAAFIKAARAELTVDRLSPPTQDVPQVTFVPAKTLPSGTVTFLFTEIEDSTRLWEQHPAAMPEALTRYNQILQQAIQEHGGVVFKTTGNSVCTAFSRAVDALMCALTAQRTLVTEGWGPLGALRVCMALHTGSAVAGVGDYVGQSINRVTQLLAVAYGSQILLSSATLELVLDELPPDVELRDLGEHRLKDLTRPEHIFQAVAPMLPVEFPQLITLDARPNNLPVQPTPLIDRSAEVVHVCELLSRPEIRLVTLIGPGGVGKTRLALQAAVELLDNYPNGVYFIPLAPLRDLPLVAPTIAQALGVSNVRDRSLVDALRAYLYGKQLLLLLDNFEQVVTAAPLVSELLAAAPQLKILVTSRTILHLRGEKEFPVQPLALPESKNALSLTQLSQHAAVQLFVARALDINPNFTITSESMQAVAEICIRLDGLPLAIELAAMWVRVFSPKALLARLAPRLALLIGGARDLPIRQQTLRDTIEWSYQLLEPAEQLLFRRLAVFAGSCTITAAEAVCNATDDPELDVLSGLFALVAKSLLRQTETGNNEPRFEMLETICEYAMEQLAVHGEVTKIEHRHADLFLSLAEAAEPKLTGKEQRTWLERLEVDFQNLRAALGRMLKWGEAESALRLSGALWQFWLLRGGMEEGRTWLNNALSLTRADLSPSFQTARATALYRAGFLAYYQGDYDQAAELCEESLSLFQTLGDALGLAWARETLGTIMLFQGDHTQATELLEESLTVFRKYGDMRGIGWSLNNLGLAAMDQGELARTAVLLEESLVVFRELGDIRSVAVSLVNLGNLAQELGNLTEAEERLGLALELSRQTGDKLTGLGCILNLGEIAHMQGNSAQAKARLEEGIRLARDMEMRLPFAFGLMVLAWVASVDGEHERAAQLLGAAATQHDITTWITPADRDAYERYLAITKTQLGPARFSAAWAAGQSMSLEQAMIFAIHEVIPDSEA